MPSDAFAVFRRFASARSIAALVAIVAALRGETTRTSFAADLGGDSPTSQAALPIAGEWRGIYYVYPSAMALKAELSADANGRVSGSIEFQPLVKTRSVVGNFAGKYGVQGTYHRSTKTIRLNPMRWIERPRRPVVLVGFDGVFDPAGPAIAGRLTRPIQRGAAHLYFALRRPQNAGSLTEPMTSALEVGKFVRRPPGAPDNQTLLRWCEKLTTEYPGLDPYRTELSALYSRAYNLFEDEHFKACFGKRFDEMSSTERRNIRFLGPLRNKSPKLRDFSGLSRAFSATGTQGTPEVMHVVLAQRTIRAWRGRHLEQLERFPVDLASFTSIDAIEAAARVQLATLWPSERKEFDATVLSTRRRIARPLSEKLASGIIRDAKGHAGARALSLWTARQQKLLRWLEDSERAMLEKRVLARLDEVIAPLIEIEVRRLEPVDEGVAGLQRTNDWFRRFRLKYGFASRRPAYHGAIRKLRAARDKQIASIRDDAIAVIGRMGVEPEINGLVRDLLPVPGDREAAPGRAILAAANRQIQRIRELKRRQAAGNLMAFGAALLQVLKLDAEKEKDRAGAAIATVLRNHLIDGAVLKYKPKATPEEVLSYRAIVTFLLDGEALDIDKELDRKELLEKLKARYPKRNFELGALDFGIQVFNELRKK